MRVPAALLLLALTAQGAHADWFWPKKKGQLAQRLVQAELRGRPVLFALTDFQ